jgi:PucR C-terminal helix-turn-helix domain
MTKKGAKTAGAVDLEPWRGLSERVAATIEPELDAVAAETLAAIAREVPEYARPFEGSFGRGIRTGVEEALRQFVALIRDPEGGRGVGREVYVALGRGELRQGRTLDSLQAAYRVGARVAWRRISAAARRADLDPEELSLLAEAIFAYIDELSADSVEGYAEAQAEVEDRRRRLRHELAAMLVREPRPPEADLRAAAGEAGWALPRTAAALACSEADLGSLARRLPAGTLATVLDGTGCLLVADPAGPGRREEIERAAGSHAAALGPTGEVAGLGASWSLARTALRAVEAGALPSGGLLVVEDRLADLAVLGSGEIAERVANQRLRPLNGLTEKAAARMRATALAFVRHGGNSVAMAEELHVHPQTARYRIARLRELLGDQLEDADARFELELALRARAFSDAEAAASS